MSPLYTLIYSFFSGLWRTRHSRTSRQVPLWITGFLLCWAGFAIAPAQAQLAPGAWPKVYADLRNTNQSRTLSEIEPDTRSTSGGVVSPLATGPSGAFFVKRTISGGEALALQALTSQEVLGEREIGVPVDNLSAEERGVAFSSPIIDPNGIVYYVSPGDNETNKLYRLDGSDPRTLDAQDPQTLYSASPVTGAPALAESGVIYVPTTEGLVAVEPSGSTLWVAPLDGTPANTPTVAPDGRIFVTTLNGGVFAIPPGGTGGEETESISEIGQSIKQPTALSENGLLYVIAFGDPEEDLAQDPRVVAIDINASEEDGSIWSTPITEGVPEGLVLGPDGNVYYTTTSSQTLDGTIVRLDGATGDKQWATPSAGQLSAPALYDRTRNLHVTAAPDALEPAVETYYIETGARTSRVELPEGPIGAPPVVAGDGSYAVAMPGVLAASPSTLPTLSAISFSDTKVGTTKQLTASLSPTDDLDPVEVLDIRISGAHAGDYAVVDPGSILGATLNDDINIPVEFAPPTTVSGTRSASLVVETTAGSVSSSLQGTATAPSVVLSSASLDFGNVELGEVANRSVDVENSGSASLEITGITITGDPEFSDVTGTSGSIVSPSESTTIDVEYAPSTETTHSGTLVLSTATQGDVTVSLTGTGVPSGLNLSPDPVTFGDVPINSASTQAVTLSITDTDVTINGASINGSNVFSVSSVPNQVQSGIDETLDVTFDPSTRGTKSATLELETSIGLVTAALQGNGTAAVLNANQSNVNFGTVEDSVDVSVTLENTGDLSLNLGEASWTFGGANPGAFSVVSGNSGVLGIGGTTELVLRYTPTADGQQTATLEVSGGLLTTYMLVLTGTGVSAQLDAPTSLAFGDVSTARSATRSVAVSNSGSAEMEIEDVSISGPDAGDFTVVNAGDIGEVDEDETLMIEIAFAPSSPSQKTAQLNIETDEDGLDTSVGLSGNGVAPDLSLSTTTVDFGSISLGSDQRRTLTVTNPTSVDVEVSSVTLEGGDPSEFSVQSGGGTTLLGPGAERTIEVKFQPSADGSFAAELVIEVEQGTAERVVDLVGTAASEVLSASPSPLNFSGTPMGGGQQKTLTLTNNLTSPVTIDAITFSGPDASNFSDFGPFLASIDGSASGPVTIGHFPDTDDTDTATLKISYNDGTTNRTLQVPLSGTGSFADFDASPTGVDFGEVRVQSSATDVSITITNNSSSDTDLTDLRIAGTHPGDFAITANDVTNSILISNGGTYTFDVGFTPQAAGSRSAEVVVETTNGISTSVPLSGTGVEAALTLSENSLDYGVVRVGETDVSSITVTNPTSVPVDLDPALLQGTGGSAYSVSTGSLGGTLAAGASKTIDVTFAPAGSGTQSAQLIVSTADGSVERIVDLTGTGLVGLEASRDTVDFGPQLTSSSGTIDVTIANPNTVSRDLTDVVIRGSGSDAFTVTDPSPVSIGPDGDQTLSVGLVAGAAGTYAATLDVMTPLDTLRLPIVAEVIAAPTLAPQPLDFGQVPLGQTASRSLSVQNNNAVLATIDSVRITGSDAFRVTTATPLSVNANTSAALDVEVQPDAVGSISETLTVNFAIDFQGTIEVLQRTVTLEAEAFDPSELTVSRSTIDFQTVAAPEGTSSRPLLFVNTGTSTLTFGGATLSGDRDAFSIRRATSDTLTTPPIVSGDTLAAGDTLRALVTATPPTGTTYVASLSVTSDGGDANIALQALGVDVALQVGTFDRGQPVPVTVEVPEFTPSARRSLFVRPGGASTYEEILLESQGTTYTAQIPAEKLTLRGLDYYLWIDSGTNSVTLPRGTPATSAALPYHAQVNFENVTAPVAPPPEAYRMVSVPVDYTSLQFGEVFFDDYGPYDPREWRLLRFDPSIEDYREGRGLRDIRPGDAFWLTTKSGMSYTLQDGQSADASRSVRMEVEPGWNQIASPFGFPVAWADIENTRVLQDPVAFDGRQYAYAQPTIDPWSGVWVFNPTSEPVTLVVPPRAASAGGQQNQQLARKTAAKPARSEDGYTLQVQARLQNLGRTLRDDATYLGLRQGAASGADDYDFAKAPPIGNHVQVSIQAENRVLAGSYRPTGADGQAWDATVSAAINEGAPGDRHTVRLRLLEHGARPDGHELFVFDLDRKIPLPVEGGAVTVPVRVGEPTPVRIVVGTEAFARSKSDGIATRQYENALDKTYPNPFTESTTIDYQLRSPTHVRIEVYDLLGRRIHTLVDARQSAGPHQVTWTGRSGGAPAASGVYFVRLRAGDFTETRKMTLIR